jgi:MOSC domain-containing protein YiiM
MMAVVQTGEVVGLFRPGPKGEPMQPLAMARAIAGVGLEGDRKARPGSKRQVLLMDQETIAAFGFRPGELDENITTHGLALSTLRRGQRIRVGDVLLEATIQRPSCHKLDELKPGLGDELVGRRGMMAVVLDGGEIRIGDGIEVLEPAPKAG